MHRPRGRSSLNLDRANLIQRVLNVASHFGREDRAWIHRLRHRLLPCSQQAFHCLAGVLRHDQVGVHESSVEISTEIHRVWGANIFDDRIKYIEGWEFELGSRLQRSVAIKDEGATSIAKPNITLQ